MTQETDWTAAIAWTLVALVLVVLAIDARRRRWSGIIESAPRGSTWVGNGQVGGRQTHMRVTLIGGHGDELPPHIAGITWRRA